MDFPHDRKYSASHEWAMADGDVVRVGITSFAAEQLGDIIYLDLPEVGREVEAGSAFGEIESVKAVSDLIAPISGEVVEVNEPVADDLDAIADDPWSAWMIAIAPSDPAQMDALLDAAAYAKLVEEEG